MVKFASKNKSTAPKGLETYEERVSRLYEGRTNLPVIEKGSEAWSSWMNYFSYIGHNHGKPNSFASLRGRMTVPEINPDTFDPGFHCSNHTDHNYSVAAE